MTTRTEDCLTCLGTGNAKTIFHTDTPCPTCQGKGKLTIITDDTKKEQDE